MISNESDAFFSNLGFMLILCRHTKIEFLLITPILSVMRGRFCSNFSNFITSLQA